MISIVSLNARIQTALDGANAFSRRKEGLFRCLLAEQPDLIGMQELTPAMLAAFEAGLPGYGFLGRASKAGGKGEYTAIAYRRQTIQPLDQGTFWLSPLPDCPGSRYLLQSPDPRTCTWAELRHRHTGTTFRYFNTHLDHLSPLARARGVGVILRRMAACQRRERLPLFWGGDLNFTPGSRLYAQCLDLQGQPLVDLTEGVPTTFNWFGMLRRPLKLDYLFTDAGTAADAFTLRVLERGPDGRYLSDHNALRVDWRPVPSAVLS